MRGMFEQISVEIVDAAKIDGCGTWQIFWPEAAAIGQEWSGGAHHCQLRERLGRVFARYHPDQRSAVRTIPVVLASAFGGMGARAWPRIAAIYIMVITPGIIVFAFAQRWYMKGLLEGALKF